MIAGRSNNEKNTFDMYIKFIIFYCFFFIFSVRFFISHFYIISYYLLDLITSFL